MHYRPKQTPDYDRPLAENTELHQLNEEQRREINNLHLIIADALTCLQDDSHYLARIQRARQVLGQAEQFKTQGGNHA